MMVSPRRAAWRARVAAVAAVLAIALGGLAAITPASAAESASPADVGVQSSGVATAREPSLTADLTQFRPGNIISDAVFFNSGAMSEAQIQAFLDSKVRTCASGNTCLKDYYDTTRAVDANAMCGAYAGGGRERASTIIFRVAQACGINPQVILVTLQKEQSLVTHTDPSATRYRIAMGQGCPDTAACDTRYYGFFNQVVGAAWQFKRYANPPGTSNYFTWYPVGRTSNILYNPNAACGSSPVLIENQATAGLYYYTPYQPNAAALRAGYGEGDGCSAYGNRNFFNYFSDWFGSTQGGQNPFGNFESARSVAGAVNVTGWAIDPDTTGPIEVHVYVGGRGTAVVAGANRPDVGAAYPASGANHGFNAMVPAAREGVQDVCVYAINAGGGANPLLGCRSVDVKGPLDAGGVPFGNFEALTAVGTTATATGWAIDPDTSAPVKVRFEVGGAVTEVVADVARADVGAAYPSAGPSHGFAARLTLPGGTSTVCATVLNNGVGGDKDLGCRSVTTVALPTQNVPPVGYFESVSASQDSITVTGWVLDPNTTDPIGVHVYVDGVGTSHTANASRPDVGASYPGYGDRHGFVVRVPSSPGTHQVCVYAIDDRGGDNPTLGCRSVTISAPLPAENRPPFGNFESVQTSATSLTVSGWAIDPNGSGPTEVHVYVDGVGKSYLADVSRPDVAAAYPAYGAKHGFVATVALAPGTHQVCVYAIDDRGGENTTLGCRSATIASPNPPATENRVPFGNLESVTASQGGVRVSGWAIDPDIAGAIEVHVYVDGSGRAFVANLARPDVGKAFPGAGDGHGFVADVPAAAGERRVCVYAIDNAGGQNTTLGCASARVP